MNRMPDENSSVETTNPQEQKETDIHESVVQKLGDFVTTFYTGLNLEIPQKIRLRLQSLSQSEKMVCSTAKLEEKLSQDYGISSEMRKNTTGIYSESDDTIYLPDNPNFTIAVHEALHFITASPDMPYREGKQTGLETVVCIRDDEQQTSVLRDKDVLLNEGATTLVQQAIMSGIDISKPESIFEIARAITEQEGNILAPKSSLLYRNTMKAMLRLFIDFTQARQHDAQGVTRLSTLPLLVRCYLESRPDLLDERLDTDFPQASGTKTSEQFHTILDSAPELVSPDEVKGIIHFFEETIATARNGIYTEQEAVTAENFLDALKNQQVDKKPQVEVTYQFAEFHYTSIIFIYPRTGELAPHISISLGLDDINTSLVQSQEFITPYTMAAFVLWQGLKFEKALQGQFLFENDFWTEPHIQEFIARAPQDQQTLIIKMAQNMIDKEVTAGLSVPSEA